VKEFAPGQPVRLVLPWMPPVSYENPLEWVGTLRNSIDDSHVLDSHAVGKHEFQGDEIAIYLSSDMRKNEFMKRSRQDKSWDKFLRRFPEARLEWADDVLKDD
jgi:hypothetical protein